MLDELMARRKEENAAATPASTTNTHIMAPPQSALPDNFLGQYPSFLPPVLAFQPPRFPSPSPTSPTTRQLLLCWVREHHQRDTGAAEQPRENRRGQARRDERRRRGRPNERPLFGDEEREGSGRAGSASGRYGGTSNPRTRRTVPPSTSPPHLPRLPSRPSTSDQHLAARSLVQYHIDLTRAVPLTLSPLSPLAQPHLPPPSFLPHFTFHRQQRSRPSARRRSASRGSALWRPSSCVRSCKSAGELRVRFPFSSLPFPPSFASSCARD